MILQGITNNKVDISVDIIRIVTLPLLAKWGVTEGCSLQIKKRGAEPLVLFIFFLIDELGWR